jgi:two-component system chemotaxis sensor kinase CheA
MDLSQYAELFLAESREHLGTINQQLLEWERVPESGEPVGGIFRAVHTIKGMAATMGYADVTDLAHRMENLLDILRSGEHEATDQVFELLFQAADALDKVVESSVSGRELDADTSDVLARLDATCQALVPTAKPRPPPVPRSVDPPQAAGKWVRVVIDPSATLKGARAAVVLRRLEQIGQVNTVQPPATVFETEDFDGEFGLRIETSADDEVIEEQIRAAGDIAEVYVGNGAGDRLVERPEARTRHIRVDLRRVDAMMNLVGELVTTKDRLAQLSAGRGDPTLDDVSLKMSHLTTQLQSEILDARMTPVWQVFDRFPRLVRDLSKQLGKVIEFKVEGKEIELDRAILDEIADPLVHLLRNAVDHGIEPAAERVAAGKPPSGHIVLSAVRERATVAIQVSDDGRGIDRAKLLADAKRTGMLDEDVDVLSDELLLRVLSRPGFSTAAAVSNVSGRGVGIDAVASSLRTLGGGLEVLSVPGQGTVFSLRLPITLAIVRALTAEVGEERYLLPVTHVAETVDLSEETTTSLEGEDAMLFRGEMIPLLDLRKVVQLPGEGHGRRPVVVLQIGERRSGLVVDALTGQQEIVVKTFDAPRGTLPIFSGATVLGDGSPALILDTGGLV